MSAYRAPASREPEPPRDVREFTIRRHGTFAMVVWSGLAVVSGAVIAAGLWWGTAPGFDRVGAMRILLVGTLVTAVFAVLLVALEDEQLRFVARVEDGVLEVTKRRLFRRPEVREFRLSEISGVSVDDHGEDHVATFIHCGKDATPVFVTVQGHDARRVEAFLDAGVTAWRDFTRRAPAPA